MMPPVVSAERKKGSSGRRPPRPWSQEGWQGWRCGLAAAPPAVQATTPPPPTPPQAAVVAAKAPGPSALSGRWTDRQRPRRDHGDVGVEQPPEGPRGAGGHQHDAEARADDQQRQAGAERAGQGGPGAPEPRQHGQQQRQAQGQVQGHVGEVEQGGVGARHEVGVFGTSEAPAAILFNARSRALDSTSGRAPQSAQTQSAEPCGSALALQGAFRPSGPRASAWKTFKSPRHMDHSR
jgi:hypothetical protein